MFALVIHALSPCLVLPYLPANEWCRNEEVTLYISGQQDIKSKSAWGLLGKIGLFIEESRIGRGGVPCAALGLDRATINHEMAEQKNGISSL